MVNILDRNDNQGTSVFWALDPGRGHKRGPGAGVTAGMFFQIQTRFASSRRYVGSIYLS
jgi:hypothetical protein